MALALSLARSFFQEAQLGAPKAEYYLSFPDTKAEYYLSFPDTCQSHIPTHSTLRTFARPSMRFTSTRSANGKILRSAACKRIKEGMTEVGIGIGVGEGSR